MHVGVTISPDVFPTHVGMNRAGPACGRQSVCIPHACGDEPADALAQALIILYSPRMWG